MNNKRLHGLHNNELCDLLISMGNDDFNDWIVTTAFYSALHFVHHYIFPLNLQDKTYRSFDVYYLVEQQERDLSKHTVTRNLVGTYISELSVKYNWLFKECYNARYRNYIVHKSIAKSAKQYLDEIRKKTDK